MENVQTNISENAATRQADALTAAAPTAPAELVAELVTAAHGRILRTWRLREQRDTSGRDWADYHGPARADETTPAYVGRGAVAALEALIALRADASMGGFRYGKITAGRTVVATITRRGGIEVAP